MKILSILICLLATTNSFGFNFYGKWKGKGKQGHMNIDPLVAEFIQTDAGLNFKVCKSLMNGNGGSTTC